MFVLLTVQRVGWPSDSYVVELKGEMTAVNAIVRAADFVGQALESLHGDGMDYDFKFEASQTNMLDASVRPTLHEGLFDTTDDEPTQIHLTANNALWTFPNGTVWHLDGL